MNPATGSLESAKEDNKNGVQIYSLQWDERIRHQRDKNFCSLAPNEISNMDKETKRITPSYKYPHQAYAFPPPV
jgi:hypothetical protein